LKYKNKIKLIKDYTVKLYQPHRVKYRVPRRQSTVFVTYKYIQLKLTRHTVGSTASNPRVGHVTSSPPQRQGHFGPFASLQAFKQFHTQNIWLRMVYL